MMTNHDTNMHRALGPELIDLAQNKRLLRFYTVLSIIGLVVTGLSDVGAVGYAMFQRYLDAYGNFTGNWFVLAGVSLFSLFVYFGIGIAWKAGQPKLAEGLYLFIVLVLAVTLWPVELDRSQELWDSALEAAGLDGVRAPFGVLAAIKFCFLVALDLLWAVVFTMGGLAFIWCKARFEYYLEQWRIRAELIAKRAQCEQADAAADEVDRLAQWVAHVKENFHGLGRHAFRLALEQETAAVTAKRDACLRRARAVTTSAGDAATAQAEADKLTAWLEACGASDDRDDTTPTGKTGSPLRPLVNGLLLAVALGAFSAPAFAQTATPAAAAFFDAMAEAEQERHEGPWETALAIVVFPLGLLLAVRASQMARRLVKRWRGTAGTVLVFTAGFAAPMPARAQSSAELCDRAPRLVIALDQSSSSPLRHAEFATHVTVEIVPLLDKLPMCSKVVAFTFGDGRVLPTMYRETLLARRVRGVGTTKAEIARQVRALLAGMPAMIKEHPQERSEILGAFADMVRLLNPRATGNRLVMVSDGAESSVFANCEGRRDCKLPAPAFSLKGIGLNWWGIGAGMDAGRAAKISKTFEGWFKQAGLDVRTYNFVRVF